MYTYIRSRATPTTKGNNYRQMMIIAGGEPELCRRRHAKREGGVYILACSYAIFRQFLGPLASFPGFPALQFLITCSVQFLIACSMHTAKEQKLDGEKAWKQGYRNSSLNIIIFVGAALQLKMVNTLKGH